MSPPGGESTKELLYRAVWRDNAVLRQVLGICSTLAVTNLVLNTFVMCAALSGVTALSCMTVSVLRNYTPGRIRMMVEVLIIAFYVILFDILLKAYWPEMSRQLGPYVGLIITNCIIMGRCEAFAKSNPPVPAMLDGLLNGIGYSLVLLLVATIREAMGMGSFAGIPLPFFSGPYWANWIVMVTPPGAFFTLGVIFWVLRNRTGDPADKEAAS